MPYMPPLRFLDTQARAERYLPNIRSAFVVQYQSIEMLNDWLDIS